MSEKVRQQYLSAMGIQAWYDPALDITQIEKIPAESESVASPSSQGDRALTESSAQRAAEQQNNTVSSPLNVQPGAAEITGSHDSLSDLSSSIEACELCELHTVRKQAITGEGDADARLMIIIDAPQVGVSQAGAQITSLLAPDNKSMLQSMLRAIGFDLSAVYLTSLVKCQPPEQRSPFTSEMVCCDDHLSAQVNLIQPEVIMVLGEKASQQLLVSQKSLADLRLRQHKYQGVPVYASFHPHELPGSATVKRKAWQDLLQIKSRLGR